MEKICIGKIINTFGLKGEVKIESYSDFDAERYAVGNTVYIEDQQEMIPVNTASIRFHKGFPLVSFKEHQDINLIEKYKGDRIYVDRDTRAPLKKDEYYQTDLLDLKAYDEDQNLLGRVTAVEPTNGAQNNLRIETPGRKTFLVPYIPEFIKAVDLKEKKIIIHKEEGLL